MKPAHHHSTMQRTHGILKGASSVSNKTQQPVRSSTEVLSAPQGGYYKQKGKPGDLKNDRQMICRYCKQQHWSDQCMKYPTLKERKSVVKGCCFNCLRSGHFVKQCTANHWCVYCQKESNHHRSLCRNRFSPGTTEEVNVADEEPVEDSPPAIFNTKEQPEATTLAAGDTVLMQTALVNVKNPNGSKTEHIRVCLDSGSHRSYITEKLAEKLQLKQRKTNDLSVIYFGSDKPKQLKTSVARMNMVLRNGDEMQLQVNIVPKITGTIYQVPINVDHVRALYQNSLADTLPSRTEASEVDFLIGNDYYLDLLLPESKHPVSGHDHLFLLATTLGFVLAGHINSDIPMENDFCSISMFIENSLPVKPNLEEFWKLETIGIKDSPYEADDDVAIERFNKTVKFENNRYHVTWPWKEEYPELPENYHLALGRLQSTVKKLNKDPELLKKYDGIIQDQVSKGIIEKVTNETVERPRMHYIPHQAVITPLKSTTKLRIVYDASAKVKRNQKSLNECLLRGPVLLKNLCGILLRFRLNKIALVADIEKAFLQFGLQVPDRDVTRFFWLKVIAKACSRDNTEVYRFCRVPFGAISSPSLLEQCVRYHLQQNPSVVSQLIQENIYVDNLLTGVELEEIAKDFYTEAKMLLHKASMNLREWGSNSTQFLEFIPKRDQINSSTTKVLGVHWDMEKDTLSIPGLDLKTMEMATTKRDVLHCIASVYDPLGLLAPVVVKAKVFVQGLWEKKLEWDDQIPQEDLNNWKIISSNLKEIPGITLPRCLSLSQRNNSQLICFTDASEKNYSAAVYLRQSSLEDCRVDLIFAKTRLAPKKLIGIPRLGLLGVLIGVRCLKFVTKELPFKIDYLALFMDSQCVLYWIQSCKPLPVFVKNRLREIKAERNISF